jgi:N6-adenosine-specific RNA methylase IME4
MQVIIDKEFHSLIPSLTTEEYLGLEQSIVAEGCRDAIVLWQGIIIDGHNRHEICNKNNIEYKTIDKEFDDRDKVKEWIILNQFSRRNLSAYQRSVLALKLEGIFKEKAKEQQIRKPESVSQISAEQKIDTRKELAKIAGVSHDTITKVKKIEEEAPKEIKDKVKSGDITINKAYQEVKKIQRGNEPKIILPLPEGKYSTIYIDPPWPVGSIVMDKWESSIEDKYPTMSLEEIMNLPIERLSSDNCNLFLWTTHTFLPDALEIIKKWNFKYYCLITWDKGNGWTQCGFNRRTEFLIYAYKGKILIDYYGGSIPTLISETKTYHSKKPDKIRDLIKSKTPDGRLEMFARGNFEGWVCWGNEVKKND